MGSVTAFPPEPGISSTRPDANVFRNGADLDAGLESDEQRHRDRVNLLAAIAAILLIAAGWWIASSFVETQKAQGCYASGTRYCSLI
jgi:hypothetical protein